MSFFDRAMDDVGQLQKEILGPNYNYSKQIKSPQSMGMGSKGSMKTLTNNIKGLTGYTQLLVSGGGAASKVKGPLGDKFFLETGAKCKDNKTGKSVTRSLYISNVPDGSIPFISQGMGTNFKSFKGLVPGTMSNLNRLNPFEIFQAFMAGTNPDCQAVTLETIDVNNKKRKDTKYLTNVDIRNMSPCLFPSKKNPITRTKCKEAFRNIHDSDMPDDPLIQLYYSTLGLFGVYILLRFLEKYNDK